LANFKKEAHNSKAFECVDEDDCYITMKYGENSYRVKKELFKSTISPKFHFGQKVILVDSPDQDATVTGIKSHYDKQEHCLRKL